MKKNTLFIFILSLFSCATPKISVTSFPDDAQVYSLDEDGKKVLVGVTPLIKKQVPPNHKSGGHHRYILSIEKDGFIAENFHVEFLSGSDNLVKANLRPVIEWKDTKNTLAARVMDGFARSIQAINQLISQKNYNDAQKELVRLISIYPEVSLLHDLQGSTYILQNQRDYAIKSYERSLQLNPLNVTTRKYLEELKKL